LRWLCKRFGFERLSLKRRKLRCYFIKNGQSSYYETAFFQQLLGYVSTKGIKMGLSLKQSTQYLIMIKDGVKNLKDAQAILKKILEDVTTLDKTLQKKS